MLGENGLLLYLQEERVQYQADQVQEEFCEDLKKCNTQVEHYVEDLEVALTVFDDALTNGMFLTQKADDFEVLERYKESSKELERLLKDDAVEKPLKLYPAHLIKG